MTRLAVSLFALTLLAQRPSAVVRGVVEECDVTETGMLKVRVSGVVLKFSYDSKTYMERDKERLAPRRLLKGDPVEVLCERSYEAVRYARLVNVVNPEPAAPAPARLRAYRAPLDELIPRGTLTFAGSVSRLGEGNLMLRTRSDGDKAILLRRDTRYLQGGETVERGALEVNTVVFVRAGRNLEGEIEAYQVVWGGILSTKSPQ